jgi:hypothetical protein
MTDNMKPLHVRVAEALGCKPYDYESEGGRSNWDCPCESYDHGAEDGGLIEYGSSSTDSRAWAMEMVETYKIDLCREIEASVLTGAWIAYCYQPYGLSVNAIGVTPSEAVANLVIALGEKGKL